MGFKQDPWFLKIHIQMSKIQSKITWHMRNQASSTHMENFKNQQKPMLKWHRCWNYQRHKATIITMS